jgi:Flp pilus assembly protein TadD/serine/threonine protein kinase
MNADPNPAKALFLEAVEKHDPDQWPAFLDRACAGEPDLRRRVEGLLEAHREVGTGPYRAATEGAVPSPVATVDEQPIGERPGTVIGPYKLMEQIGEGGMGLVFVAEQTHPVRRKVALKVIKPGMDTRQVVARFEAERQALALMDHPNIAKVLDGGETASGRPYFVMELVKGVPITKICDDNRLTTRERLELFVPVCEAVQHAHQKGIIHRDLKPSNVLVASHDGKPVVQVIDFGVAKAVGQHLTDKTVYTLFAQMIGTPLYMSPEQAGESSLDVDTRSDIYSLGVLLYELLTGTTPFDKDRLRTVGYDEMRRIIREEEPARPSARISTLGQAAATVSANRRSDPKKLSRVMRGELDWIVMKALEKDRNRRYETAIGLARDVQRYLNDEPVQACPPSAWYRFRKFARRKKAALATAAVLALAALLAGGGGLWLLGQRVARDRDVSVYLHEAEGCEREGDWQQALRAVERAEGRLAGSGPAALRQRAEQIRERVQFVADLEESRVQNSAAGHDALFDHARADRAYAEAFKKHGWDVQALPAEELAEEIAASPIRVYLVAALDDWAAMKGPKDVAGRETLRAIARLADDDDSRRQLRDPAVGKDRAALERLARQRGVLDQPPGNLELLAEALVRRGARPAAVDLLRRAQQRHPGDFWINHYLASLLMAVKPARVEEAVGFFRVAVALRPQSAGAYHNLGLALYDQRRLPEAEAAYRRAIELKPDYPEAYVNLANALYHQKRLAEAEAAHRKALELKPDFPEAYKAYDNLGNALSDQGKLPEAEAAHRKAIELKPDSAMAYNNLGTVLRAQGRLPEAEAAFRKAIELKPDFAMAYSNLGGILRGQRKPAEAEAACRKAIELKPDDVELKSDDAVAYTILGNALLDQRKLAEAEAAHRKAIELRPDLPEAHTNLGNALLEQGKLPEAEAAHRKAIDLNPDYAGAYSNLARALSLQRKLAEAEAAIRKAIALRPDHAEAYDNLGNVLLEQGKLPEAEAAIRKAIELKPDLPSAYVNLGVALYLQRRLAEAEAAFGESVRLNPMFAQSPNDLAWHLANVPDPKQRDGRQAVAFAQLAAKAAPTNGNYWNTLGAAHYRAGNWKEAVAALEKSVELRKGGDSSNWFFLAMAHWKLGEKEEARTWFDRAVQWMDKNQPGNEELGRFRAEAAELLGMKAK